MKGGEKLKRALARIASQLEKAGTLRVGFLENARYPDGKQVAMIAALQDFGAPKVGIPPRPFFRNMVAQESPGWPPAIGFLLKKHDYDTALALRDMGQHVKEQLQQSIRDTNSPPLKERTIRRKGFSKPLIHTSHMINSADYEVK